MTTNLGAILLDGELRDRERQKSKRRETRLQGFDVFLEGFSRALLTHSQHGPVLFPQEALASFRSSAPPWFLGTQGKVRAVPASDPAALASWERLVLLSMGPEMLQYAWLRAEANRPDWPITAILHSPQLVPRIRYLFTNHLLGTLGPHDALVCPSQAARSVLRATFEAVPESLRSTRTLPMELPVIPMGVDAAHWSGLPKEEARRGLKLPATGSVVLSFGRFSPTEKGELLPFLQLFAPLAERHQACLVLAGDDTTFQMAPTIRELAQELGYGDRIAIFPDVSQDEKRALFSAADLFLSLTNSMHEGFALTLAEAMASGLPAVASDWGGHRELVEDGYSGRLIPVYLPSNPDHALLTLYSGAAQEHFWELSTALDLPALRAALDELLGNPSQLAAMAENARRFALQYLDWQVVMAQYDTLWRELLARGARVPRDKAPFPRASFPSVFATYPTRHLHGRDVIAAPLDAPSEDFLPALGGPPHFRQDLFRHLLQTCRGTPPGAHLDEIVASVCESLVPITRPAEVERHIGRLMKHGLLEITHPERWGEPSSAIAGASMER